MYTWFRRVNVRNKVLLGYATSLLLMVVLGVLAFRGLQYSLETSRSVQHSQLVLRDARELLLGLVNMETGERGFIITGDETFLQPYNESVKSVASLITDTEALVSDNPAQTQRMLQIAAAAQDWQHGIVEPEIQARRSSADSAAALVKTGQGKAALDKVRALSADFTNTEQDLLTSRAHSSDDANQQLQAVIVGGTTLAALLGLVGALSIAQSLARRVNVVASAAQAVSEGDFSQTVPALESGDEIDTLGQAFNVMTQSLREGESTKVDKQTLESVLGESQTASSNLASTASEILASVTEQEASATQQAAAVTEATATVDEVLTDRRTGFREGRGRGRQSTAGRGCRVEGAGHGGIHNSGHENAAGTGGIYCRAGASALRANPADWGNHHNRRGSGGPIQPAGGQRRHRSLTSRRTGARVCRGCPGGPQHGRAV